MDLRDFRLGQTMTLTGLAETFDMTNGREGDECELLPSGQLRVTLLVDFKSQDSSKGETK